jgi:ATP-dependent protease ClpP protease subunit
MRFVLRPLCFVVTLLVSVCEVAESQEHAKKTVTIRFFDEVNQGSVNTLLKTVDDKLKAGTERFVLLISSPGGNVFYGMSAYNYLKGIPAEVVTHNFGQVDSIAALIYCAGSKRYSVPQGEFLLHGLSVTLPGNVTLEQGALDEQMKQMENQVDAISRVISTVTGKKQDEIRAMLNKRTVLSADDAKKLGLVQEIRESLIPDGSEVISIQPAPRAEVIAPDIAGSAFRPLSSFVTARGPSFESSKDIFAGR